MLIMTSLACVLLRALVLVPRAVPRRRCSQQQVFSGPIQHQSRLCRAQRGPAHQPSHVHSRSSAVGWRCHQLSPPSSRRACSTERSPRAMPHHRMMTSLALQSLRRAPAAAMTTRPSTCHMCPACISTWEAPLRPYSRRMRPPLVLQRHRVAPALHPQQQVLSHQHLGSTPQVREWRHTVQTSQLSSLPASRMLRSLTAASGRLAMLQRHL